MASFTTEATDESQEQERVAALHSLNLMGTDPEERFDRITRIARELFHVPVAAVNLLDDKELFIKSPTVPGARTMDRADTFCDVTISGPDLLVVEDAAADPRFASKPDVAGGRGVRFYAGRPLTINGEHRVGTLCLFDSKSRVLSEADRRVLDELGSWAERELYDSMDLDRAHDVQQALLPSSSPGAPSYELAGMNLPAHRVGGDFYTWNEADSYLDVTLADVMGKGTAAALMAATVRAATNAAGTAEPSAAFNHASQTLAEDLDATGVFATGFRCRLNLKTGELRYADAGHGLSLIVSPDGEYRQLRSPGLPLGLGGPGSWQANETKLQPGQVLVSFTDGVLDLYDGTLAALDEVAELVRQHPHPSTLIEALRRLAPVKKRDDDITVIALRRVN